MPNYRTLPRNSFIAFTFMCFYCCRRQISLVRSTLPIYILVVFVLLCESFSSSLFLFCLTFAISFCLSCTLKLMLQTHSTGITINARRKIQSVTNSIIFSIIFLWKINPSRYCQSVQRPIYFGRFCVDLTINHFKRAEKVLKQARKPRSHSSY